MFFFNISYTNTKELKKYIEAHRRYLDKHFATGDFIFCGRRKPRTGGIIMSRINSREKAEQVIAEDPYLQHGVATYEMIEFEPFGCTQGFHKFIEEV